MFWSCFDSKRFRSQVFELQVGLDDFHHKTYLFIFQKKSRSRHVTTKCTMGPVLSREFDHPDLLVTFACNPAGNCCSQKWYRCNSSGCCVGDKYGCFGFSCGHTTDPGWVRNSPLRIELVDLLDDALKAMGGWPSPTSDCCFAPPFSRHVAPQMVFALNKVCKKFNDAKLFDMGLQCRAIIFQHIKDLTSPPTSRLLVLVEKKCEYKLADMGDTHDHLRWLEEGQNQVQNCLQRSDMKSALAWSPPEDWMTRLSPPYNEATNHV